MTPQEAAADGAEEAHRLPQARQADGHVQRRAADAGIQLLAGGGGTGVEDIHQGFAADCLLSFDPLTVYR